MQCKSLWIKASAKCINVNVNVNVEKTRSDWTEERLRHALFNVLAAQTNNYTFFNDNLGHMTNWFSTSTA